MKTQLRRVVALLFALVLGFAAVPAESQDGIKVVLDGKPVAFDVPPTVIDGRTMVPLRKIFEALGATVEWDPAARRITGVRGNTRVELTLDNPVAIVNGKPVQMDVAPTVVDGRTLVPLRFISEALGDKVTWDGPNRAAVITRTSTPPELTAGDLALRPGDLPFPARTLREGSTDSGGYERLLIRGAPGERTGPELRTHWLRVGPGMADLLPGMYCSQSETPVRYPALGDAAVACTRPLAGQYQAVLIYVAWKDWYLAVGVGFEGLDTEAAYELGVFLAAHELKLAAALAGGSPRPAAPTLPAPLQTALDKVTDYWAQHLEPFAPADQAAPPEEVQARKTVLDIISLPTSDKPFSAGPGGKTKPAAVGVPYSFSLCRPEVKDFNDLCGWPVAGSPSGGRPPYTFWVESGFPAPGLKLLANGLLTGVPEAAGAGRAHEFKVCVKDLAGATNCAPVTTEVSEAPAVEPLEFQVPEYLPGGRVGVAYRYVFTAAKGLAPYTFRAEGALPPGLSLSADGVLRGTPGAGTYWNHLSICAADSLGGEVCRKAELPINQNVDGPLYANSAWSGTFRVQDIQTHEWLTGTLEFRFGPERDDGTIKVLDAKATFREKLSPSSFDSTLFCNAGEAKCGSFVLYFSNLDKPGYEVCLWVYPKDPPDGAMSPTLITGGTSYQGGGVGSFTVSKQ